MISSHAGRRPIGSISYLHKDVEGRFQLIFEPAAETSGPGGLGASASTSRDQVTKAIIDWPACC